MPGEATDCDFGGYETQLDKAIPDLVLMILLTQAGIFKNSVQVTQHTTLRIDGTKVQTSLWKIIRARTQQMVQFSKE